MASPASLRQQIRNLRRAVPSAQRHQAALQLLRQVASLKIFSNAHHIAGYLAFDGELDPAPLLERAMAVGKQVYLPVLPNNSQAPMVFAPYQPGTVLKPNRFGILEPDVPAGQLLLPQRLDLALTPLVAFDVSGTRMGMGGGFYDRTFTFRRNPAHLCKPHLLGLAYEFQKVSTLIRQPWDIPLDGIATEQALYPSDSNYLLE